MLVGFSRSGKTTLAKKIINNFPELVRIDSDSILEFLNNTYPLFQDDNTVRGKAYEIRQKSNKAMQEALISVLLKYNYSILLDSNNGRKYIREKILKTVQNINSEIKTIIIRHRIDEKVLYCNIKKADQKKGDNIWKDLYEKVQKSNFDEPVTNEADYFLVHTNNTEEIISKIKLHTKIKTG